MGSRAGSWGGLTPGMGLLLGWAGSWDGLAGSREELAPGMDPAWDAIYLEQKKSGRPQPILVDHHFIFFSGRGMRRIA